MTTKQKYTEILKEVVRNEAISKDKLVLLAEKHGANKLKIEGYLRKAGVIEKMGKGVNRVLIRGKEIEPHVEEILVLTKGGYKKKEELDMGLPGKWTSTKEQTDNERVDMDQQEKHASTHPDNVSHDLFDDPNTHARSKPYFDDPDMGAAENDIDLHQRMLEMIEGLNTRITNQNALIEGIESQVDTFMKQVKYNTNKQNEYIATLERRIDNLEKKGSRHEAYLDKLWKRTEGGTIEQSEDIKKRIDELEKQIEMLEHHRIIHDNRIQALQLITKGHKTEISNGGVLKALHQLLGEII